MRIHTRLYLSDLALATKATGVNWTRLTEHGSRFHPRAFEVILTGSSTRNQNGGEFKAATWDEWGTFLGYLFDRDPGAKASFYSSGEHFHWATADRFLDGFPPDPHPQHRWEFFGSFDRYHEHVCAGCSALTRTLRHGVPFTDLTAGER